MSTDLHCLDRHFDELVRMPVNIRDVIEHTSGDTKRYIDDILNKADERTRNKLLEKRTPYEWIERSREISDVLEGITTSAEEIDTRSTEIEISDDEAEELLTIFKKLLDDVHEVDDAMNLVLGAEKIPNAKVNTDFRRYLRKRITDDIVQRLGDSPTLREIDFGIMGARIAIQNEMRELAREICNEPIESLLWHASMEIRWQVLENVAYDASRNGSEDLRSILKNTVNPHDSEFSLAGDGYPAYKYLDDTLPYEGWRLSDTLTPGQIFVHDGGLKVRIESTAANATNVSIIEMSQTAPWPHQLNDETYTLHPSEFSYVLSTKGQSELPLSLWGPPFARSTELITAEVWTKPPQPLLT